MIYIDMEFISIYFWSSQFLLIRADCIPETVLFIYFFDYKIIYNTSNAIFIA